ncbi:hypothetical protein C8J56DRAFT_202132 [Mycena floridula]|nr:hypothetical protein C8J56DRAFT_202132 [Mycena floridula]
MVGFDPPQVFDTSTTNQLFSTYNVIHQGFNASRSETPDDASTYEDAMTDVEGSPSPRTESLMDVDSEDESQPLTPSLPKRTDQDLLTSIRGMYRMLDLISEQGSGGLVEKIIIDQASFQRLLDDLCPGAYASLTKVNFKALDNLSVKPVGIYGSRECIVDLLISLSALDEATALALKTSKDEASGPKLRSGLYLVRATNLPPGEDPEQIYAVYWPEDTTWNDDAIDSVRRNRVTFMRYLTKITDQIVCFMSPAQSATIVWKEDLDETPMDLDVDDSGRLFTFEVSKTNEQEESVTLRNGFAIPSRHICVGDAPEGFQKEQFQPRLLAGETTQAFMTTKYIPPARHQRPINGDVYSSIKLQDLLAQGSLRLSEQLSDDAIGVLMDHGLSRRYSKPCDSWKRRKEEIERACERSINDEIANAKERLNTEAPALKDCLRAAVCDHVLKQYPTMDQDTLVPMLVEDIPDGDNSSLPNETNQSEQAGTEPKSVDSWSDHFAMLIQLYPEIEAQFKAAISTEKLANMPRGFRTLKERVVLTAFFLDHPEILPVGADELARTELSLDFLQKQLPPASKHADRDQSKKSSWDRVKQWIPFSSSEHPPTYDRNHPFNQAKRLLQTTSDLAFLESIPSYSDRHPILAPLVKDVLTVVQKHLRTFVTKTVNTLEAQASHTKEKALITHIKRDAASLKSSRLKESRRDLVKEITDDQPDVDRFIIINSVDEEKHSWSNFKSWRIHGIIHSSLGAKVERQIYFLRLKAGDIQDMQRDHSIIPIPQIDAKFSHIFSLEVNFKVIYCQVVGTEKCLLVLDDGRGNILICLENPENLERAILNHPRRVLNQAKLGKDLLVSYDDTKRMLLICSPSKLQLHVFQFDERFATLQGWGATIELSQWYSGYETTATICHACLICGGDEVLLIDNMAHARIFSFITQQFRPGMISLQGIPSSVYASPDSACVILVFPVETGQILHAYHLSTFGPDSPGVVLELPRPLGDTTMITSMVTRNSIHLISLDCQRQECWSVALDITKKITEFQFKEKGSKNSSSGGGNHPSLHNCLIDCHSDVWTRFPVIAAVQRGIISSSSSRLCKHLTFATDRDHGNFAPCFADMIQSFEQRKRKPTGNVLKSIQVDAVDVATAVSELAPDNSWDVSQFLLGEWLVDILCLIPIHVAITRENRFIPLKDGVSSPELEKSLLGAEVGRIVDNLSLGWYESIFQSYMAQKPVKVVSSMGEQSVGKSYSLNHLVDSSFAGSAMRTTEGIWLSVTPTDEALIVALDFEGVHSIERSAQEDTLLVLFNTAISNLVLFRNNFALSRDITGLFQSFQSSSTVLDPAANPTLFQSTLVIIIKDVVDSDKSEIVKEFSGKFQKIVQDEQQLNFITQLHAGRLSIVPWPVIESRQFYTLFPALKKRLDQQPITHPAAGEFLLTLKTLMAKLKANDWGALSQTLVAHRAQRLMGMLSIALASGFAEIQPDLEPLKNLDTDLLIEVDDSDARFFLSGPEPLVPDKDSALLRLIQSWDRYSMRFDMKDVAWVTELSDYLKRLVDCRVEHVQEWIFSNLSRFKATNHANIELLRRALDTAIIELRSNVDLCKMQCASCQLLCLRGRHGAEIAHECSTDHRCIANCDYDTDHDGQTKLCGLPAGHSGKHLCAVETHLCGQTCKLSGKRGCLGECTKVAGHEGDDHVCSADVHACGEPCQLKGLKLANNKSYSCQGSCVIPSHIEHTEHGCDNGQCPIPCSMCKRLCSHPDHFHGLEAGCVHLCGQEHSCSALCEAAGICEIDTAPQSIEATFTGRHETFQYTKYSQTAKRLQCAITIPPGELIHSGPHSHSIDRAAFHFCQARCDNCGYYCTLPRGHPQQEHETSHGSMSKTRWAVEGPEGTALELNGRRFAADDDGAPMMCNLVCQEMGRHAHLAFCRDEQPGGCGSAEIVHINERLTPEPSKPKDWITHKLYWRRSGFRDPYSRDDQANFAKCDRMCPGPEHALPNQPSYCTLPLFHPPQTSNQGIGLGYLSNDGHVFTCKNPVVMRQAFHVIFVIDRSGSMGATDRRPLPGTPVTAQIVHNHNNRLGAVYSALYAFWMSRQSALTVNGQQAAANRRDAYSIVMFDHAIYHGAVNDFTSSPDALLAGVLRYTDGGGTDYTLALSSAQAILRQHWAPDRTPIVIFLSDGECSVADETVRDLCRSSIALGKPLSFHAVSFGPRNAVMQRMVQVALDVQNSAPVDPNTPATARVPSSYSEALDSVRLAETFLGIAESLKKPRGSLL